MIASGLRILLLESDPLMADITGYRLELLSYRIVIAATSAQIWSAIDQMIPQAIILNLDSEAFDALALLEQFASDTKTSEIPILALSAEADLDRVERAWKSGVRDYLLTPYDPRTLEQKVASLLEHATVRPDVVQQPLAEVGSQSADAPELVQAAADGDATDFDQQF